MNVDLILKMVEPFQKNETLAYKDFDKLFEPLSLHEQYQVVEILFRHGIQLVDESSEESAENIPELFIQCDDECNDEDFSESDVDALFKDRQRISSKDETFVFKTIKQSNEILCQLIKDGNAQARQDLCVKNQRLVMKYAQQYLHNYGNDLEFDDLVQAGYMGLIKAAQKFDSQMGNAFTTYAVVWIKQAISREITNNGFRIRLPAYILEKIIKVAALYNQYDSNEMTEEERIGRVSEIAGFTPKQVKDCLDIQAQFMAHTSLDIPVGVGGESELSEFIEDRESLSPEDLAMEEALRGELEKVLEGLTPREMEVIQLRFGIGNRRVRTLEEIGRIFGVTRERVRQIESKALQKMRRSKCKRKLEDFLE